MNVDSCFQLGYITRPHGINGEVVFYLDTDVPERYDQLESVFIEINNKLIPFFIEQFKLQGNKAVVKLEDIDDLEATEILTGNTLYLPLDLLPDLGKDRFYYHEVIDYTIIEKDKGRLGQIKEVYEANGNDLFSVITKDEKELLIPVKDDLILKVDKVKQEIHVDLPDGLLDVYLTS